MPQEIILISSPGQTFNVVLDDQACEISLRDRLGQTYMSIIVNGEKVWDNYLCKDRQNIKPFAYMNFKGILTFIDGEGNQDPVYTGFNERYFLLYYAEGEEVPSTILDYT